MGSTLQNKTVKESMCNPHSKMLLLTSRTCSW